MHKLRLFIAIDIPNPIKNPLIEVRNALSQCTSNVKWVANDNLHLTLKFLGETEVSKTSQIISAMQEATRNTTPFSLEVSGLGTFPGRGRPKVIWAGVKGDTHQLLMLQQGLEDLLYQAGFPRESRKYSPHLTLGRPKELGELGSLAEQINKYQRHPFGQWEIQSIKLMQSTLRPTGPVYTVLAHSKLQGTV